MLLLHVWEIRMLKMILRSVLRMGKDARKIVKRRQSGIVPQYVYIIRSFVAPLVTLIFQVAQGASDIGLAWIYKEKFM